MWRERETALKSVRSNSFGDVRSFADFFSVQIAFQTYLLFFYVILVVVVEDVDNVVIVVAFPLILFVLPFFTGMVKRD